MNKDRPSRVSSTQTQLNSRNGSWPCTVLHFFSPKSLYFRVAPSFFLSLVLLLRPCFNCSHGHLHLQGPCPVPHHTQHHHSGTELNGIPRISYIPGPHITYLLTNQPTTNQTPIETLFPRRSRVLLVSVR